MPAPPARRNLFRPQINFGGHCIKKFKRIPSRTLTERASPRSRTRAGNPKNFLVFFLRILPPTPPPRSGKRNGREIFGLRRRDTSRNRILHVKNGLALSRIQHLVYQTYD